MVELDCFTELFTQCVKCVMLEEDYCCYVQNPGCYVLRLLYENDTIKNDKSASDHWILQITV